MTSAIRDLPFRHNAKPALGFEIFRLAALYRRADRGALSHSLTTPQRPQFHTLYVGLRGRGRHVVDFTPCPLGVGWVTVVAGGRVQQFTPDRVADAWMLLFSPEFISTGSTAPADPIRSILSPTWARPALRLREGERREVLALCRALEREHARPLDGVQSPLLAALLRTLLLRLERMAGREENAAPAPLQRFFTIVERDHARTRNVAHYARAAGVSPRRLAELLHGHAGLTAKRVISDRLVLEMKRLLVHTELSVKELAAHTGFAEPTNLVKFFRLHTGTTPLAFRARHRAFLPSGRRS